MKKGFTLVEMAIVLVIIALLVAAIVGGRNMLETAKLNAAVSDLKNYKIAYDKFREVYNAVPGDMRDAGDVFGLDACLGCYDSSDNTAGAGDGIIVNNIIVGTYGGSQYENLMAWQQLYLAKLVDGKFNGISTTRRATADDTVPATPFAGAIYDLYYADEDTVPDASTVGLTIQGLKHNAFVVASPTGVQPYAQDVAITPMQAFLIDTKMDNGLPETGSIIGSVGANTIGGACLVNRGTAMAPDYHYASVERTTRNCILFYLMKN